MKKILPLLLVSTSLTLSACGEMGQQWLDPDKTFAKFDQPDIKGVNDTQEDMAKQAIANEDFLRAAQFYQQLVSSDKGTAEQKLRYKMGLADSVRRLGQAQSALVMYDQLHAENPDNLDITEGRGLTLMTAGKVADAGRVFSAVIEKDPKRWRSLNALGLLFITKNMVPEAMAYFEEALNQSPDNPAVLNNMGLSQAINHDYPKAIESLDYAARLSKVSAQHRQIDLNLAMVYGVSGDMEKSREIAGKYIEGAALDNNMGLYAHLAKDDALAKSYLNMALSQSSIYYQRAWDNLDAVADSGRSGSSKHPESSAVKVKETRVAVSEPVKKKAKEENPAPVTPKPEVKEPAAEVANDVTPPTPPKKQEDAETPPAKPKAAEVVAEAKPNDTQPSQLPEPLAPELKHEAKQQPEADKPAEKAETKADGGEAPSLWNKVAEADQSSPAKEKAKPEEEKPGVVAPKPSAESKEAHKAVAKDNVGKTKEDKSKKATPAKDKSTSKSKKKAEKAAANKKAKAAAAKKKAAANKHKESEKKAVNATKDTAKTEVKSATPIETPKKVEPVAESPKQEGLELPPLPTPNKDAIMMPAEGN